MDQAQRVESRRSAVVLHALFNRPDFGYRDGGGGLDIRSAGGGSSCVRANARPAGRRGCGVCAKPAVERSSKRLERLRCGSGCCHSADRGDQRIRRVATYPRLHLEIARQGKRGLVADSAFANSLRWFDSGSRISAAGIADHQRGAGSAGCLVRILHGAMGRGFTRARSAVEPCPDHRAIRHDLQVCAAGGHRLGRRVDRRTGDRLLVLGGQAM